MNVSNEIRIMDISLNLTRIGNWTADSYDLKKNLIQRFVLQTEEYVKEISEAHLSKEIKPLFQRFKHAFKQLQKEEITEQNKDLWAERALTWANILQHRAKLA